MQALSFKKVEERLKVTSVRHIYFKLKKKIEQRGEKKKINLDNVPKAKNERLLILVTGYFRHIKFC